jgi:hypothetical protein
MAVSPEDREAYEKGIEDSKRSWDEALFDVTETFRDMARSESERAAYQKGRDGEQLDDDKK